MKKIILFLLTLVTSAAAFANIQIQLRNIPADKKIFIASLVDGKKIYAENVGNFAVVTDSSLKMYPNHTAFTVGVDNGATLQFCSNATDLSQFLFNYNVVTNTIVEVEMSAITEGSKNLIPLCNNLV